MAKLATIKPTLRQSKALELLTNGKVNTKKEILLQAGYSESSSRQPSRLIDQSPTLQQLIAKGESFGITDEFCLKTLMRSLESNDIGGANAALKLWWNLKYPESRPYFKIDNNTVNVSISPSDSLNEAYLLIAQEHKLTVDQVKERLG